MVFEIGNYCLNVDTVRTSAYYSTLNGTGCDCAGCRNYALALSKLSEPIHTFLSQFGIDPRTPIEMSVLHSPDGMRTCYDGFSHICGTILAGTEPWIQTGPKSRQLDQNYLIEITSDCSAYFTNECALVDCDFPHPIIQLHISFSLPWVLEEPNPY